MVSEGEDYDDLTENFSLTPTNSSQCFNITIIDDSILELTEYFRVTLEAVGDLPQNASLNCTQARVDIADNESKLFTFLAVATMLTSVFHSFFQMVLLDLKQKMCMSLKELMTLPPL